MTRFVSMNGLARLAGVSNTAVASNARLRARLNGEGLFDTEDPEIVAYIAGGRKSVRRKRGRDTDPDGILPQNYRDPVADAESEHEKEKLELTRQRRIKEQLKNLELMRETVPTALLVTWMSAFATGLRNNVLTAGKRIARGDKELEARCDIELARSIRAVLSQAATEVKGYAAGLSDELSDAIARMNTEIRAAEDAARKIGAKPGAKKAAKKATKKAAKKPGKKAGK